MGLAALIHCASAMDNEGENSTSVYEENTSDEAKENSLELDNQAGAVSDASSEHELGGLDEEEDEAEVITLISSDNERFEIERKHAVMSQWLKNLLEGDRLIRVVDLSEHLTQEINGEALREILDYLRAHDCAVPADLDKPIRSKNMTQIAAFQNPAANFSDAAFIDRIGNSDLGAAAAPATNDRAADLSADGKQRIFKLILGANYMDVKSLLHLGCAKVATYIKGRGPAEIKQLLADNGDHVINGQIVQGARRRRLSKDDRSVLSKMFGCAF
jgi:S-phase kinase-associated protein 1